jgi:DNA-binding transcriptional ArsR family regulator
MNSLFKALDDPTRRKILIMLKSGHLNAGQIANAFDMTKPSISKHLDILKTANLVGAKKSGQFVFYSLNKSAVKTAIAFLESLNT